MNTPANITTEANMQTELLLSDTRGVYIPQNFAELYADAFTYEGRASGYTYADALETINAGPETEWYWDAWQAILDNARHKDDNTVTLYQDGDLFMIPESEMEMLRDRGFF